MVTDVTCILSSEEKEEGSSAKRRRGRSKFTSRVICRAALVLLRLMATSYSVCRMTCQERGSAIASTASQIQRTYLIRLTASVAPSSFGNGLFTRYSELWQGPSVCFAYGKLSGV